MAKVINTLKNNWKKSIFFTGCLLYASKYAVKWHKESLLMKEYCLKAREFGRQTISASERPRKVIVFLNPAAKDGKTKYLLEKHVLPMLHLAGIEIHVVRTEHEGQAKAYMSVLDNNIVDAIVVAGGDGTLSEVVTGLLRRGDGVAQRIPIGVLPFGNTNTYATKLFPKNDLEVERFCQASMAIIQNNCRSADVIEVQPCTSTLTTPEQPGTEAGDKTADSSQEGRQIGNKNVYIMSDLKWGVHSEVNRRKGKYWYMPGPLKQHYCYIKQVLFGQWPPYVEAHVELSPPCDGCSRCLTPPTKPDVQPIKKNVWWWPTDNRVKQAPPPPPDPRLQVDNPVCGSKHTAEIRTPQLYLQAISPPDQRGTKCTHLELSFAAENPSKLDLLTKPVTVDSCTPLSQLTITPTTSQPMYIMDSENYEVIPARITLLKDKIKVFT